MEARARRHPVDFACGIALAIVVVIDLFVASTLSLVAYVQPALVTWVQFVERRLGEINLVCVLAVLLTWPFLFRHQYRRLTMAVVSLQTVGLVLDVAALLASTLFGQQANPRYLLLEAMCVHLSVVLLFAVWYAMVDHPGQEAWAAGGPARAVFAFPQNSTRYPGYERWVPGFIDYLFVSMCMSTAIGPGDVVALARPVKLLMMLQVYLALVVVVVLAARAIGLIG